jgi:hypothetical protein
MRRRELHINLSPGGVWGGEHGSDNRTRQVGGWWTQALNREGKQVLVLPRIALQALTCRQVILIVSGPQSEELYREEFPTSEVRMMQQSQAPAVLLARQAAGLS